MSYYPMSYYPGDPVFDVIIWQTRHRKEGSFDHIIAIHPIVIMTGEGGGGGGGLQLKVILHRQVPKPPSTLSISSAR